MSTSRIHPVAALLAGAVIGAAAGGSLTSGALAYFYHLRGVDADFGRLALQAGLAGIASAALIAWLIARPAGPMRGVLAAFCGVAGAFSLIVLTTYADRAAGRNGLVFLTMLCLAVGAGAWLLFLRQPAPDTSP